MRSMRTKVGLTWIIALLVVAFAGLGSEEIRTLSGEYESGGSEGPIEGKFEAQGENRWKVTFDFTFQDRPFVYVGNAEGSLSAGSLSGEVDDGKGRTFRFGGSFEDGIFFGEHEETTPGEEGFTGTMTLRPAPVSL